MAFIFLVVSGTTVPPLVVEENGVPLPVGPSIKMIGSGILDWHFGTFWRLSLDLVPLRGTELLPSSSYVLKEVHGGVETVVTQFSTAASYTKQSGQAPVLTELRLWRVHYPADQIGGGGCVFSEYVGYVDLNYQEGSLPETPAEEVISVIQLSSRAVASTSSFVFAGGEHFEGAPLWDAASQSLVDVPEDGVPDPTYAPWKPMLEPDVEYCATMTLYGRDDRGVPGVVSNQICARVRNVDTSATVGSGCSFHGSHARSGWLPVALALLGLALMWRRPRASRARGISVSDASVTVQGPE